MSAEAARIISRISGKKQTSGFEPMLGTVKALSPLTIKFDNISFDVSSGILVNNLFLDHERMMDGTTVNFENCLTVGDRIAGIAIGGTHYVILCKVVSA